jgi:ribose transport system substrate-binding protein
MLRSTPRFTFIGSRLFLSRSQRATLHPLSIFSNSVRIALSFCLLATVVCGCSCSKKEIAFVPQATADDMWEPAHIAAQEAAEAQGDYLHWNGPDTEDDTATQISLVKQVSSGCYKGLILAPNHELALMSPVRSALLSGIPVAIINSPLGLVPEGHLYYILNDDAEEGRLEAIRIGEQLHGTGEVAILGMTQRLSGNSPLIDAFETTLAGRFPQVQIVARRMDTSNFAQAEQNALEVLRQNPHLGGIVGLSRLSTKGVLNALAEIHPRPHITIIGSGQSYFLLYHLKSGELDSLVAHNTYDMGKLAVSALHADLDRRQSPHIVHVPPILITSDNIFAPQVEHILNHERYLPR